MNNWTFINVIFISLPQSMEWRSLQNILYHKRTLLTLNEVITELNTEYDHIVQDQMVDECGKKTTEDQMEFMASSGQKRSRSRRKLNKGKKKQNLMMFVMIVVDWVIGGTNLPVLSRKRRTVKLKIQQMLLLTVSIYWKSIKLESY